MQEVGLRILGKLRGKKRNLNSIIRNLDDVCSAFPNDDNMQGVWNKKLPARSKFVRDSRLGLKAKRQIVQALVNALEKLNMRKPEEKSKNKAVVVLNLSDLWDSEIAVFHNEADYNAFFNRNLEDQIMLKIANEPKSLLLAGIVFPEGYVIQTYLHKITEDGVVHESVLVTIGAN